jgi:hypothetical protein
VKLAVSTVSDGDIGLVKLMDWWSVAVDVVVVHAEAESDDGGCAVEVLVVDGVCDGFLMMSSSISSSSPLVVLMKARRRR